ncbi:MAG TPA: cysteine--tRNA ligase [Chloroflexota bacterium]|nr:cysteine--tRNA ligase [Chloroflexota bacterium]
MRLFNTMTQRLDAFEPDPIVTLYVCGVTPYDTTHLGHAFSYISFDVLIRFLRWLGHEVRYTQNVTDIDDDILRKAREVGIPWDQLGREQTERFQQDMRDLNVLPPTHYPRATAEVPGMITMIERLLDGGHAYQQGPNVYYATRTFPTFNALSRLNEQTMLARFKETGDSPDDPRKRDPLDFVLWKASAPDEPAWESPWGRGRPGWHIECSTMATRYLGPTIDIHGGGDDLIFPHHSCEIAQSEAATGEHPYVRIWMHNGVVRLDGVKMSKSLGNLVMARALLEQYPPDAIRIYLLQHHYRSSFDYREHDLLEAVRLAAVLAMRVSGSDAVTPAEESSGAVTDARRHFVTAMADDLDTPQALHALQMLAENPDPAAAEALRELGSVLGLTFATI